MTALIHSRPIDERIDWLMALSRKHSASFCSPENHLARQRYLAEHNTLIVALKCMDGRIHLPHVTRTPMGIIQPFRNLGGIFDLGWPYLGDLLADTVQNAVSAGRRVLIIITYHYSRGAKERGCAGFNCDREAARAHARDMHERGFYDHVNPDGEAPEDRVACGAGENIHRGELGPMETADGKTWYTREPDDMAGYLVRDWQLSEPHRRNLLDPQWRQQGVGIVVDGNHFFGVAMFC